MDFRGLPEIRLVLGSGRCGTWAWYRIMEAQTGLVQASHEGLPFPWEVDRAQFFWMLLNCMVDWIGTPFWCSSTFAWIRYLGIVMNTFRNPKCLILKRDRDETIASFMKHWQYENYWTDIGSDHWDDQWPKATFGHMDPERLSTMWPKYDLPKEDAIGAYWDEYYLTARYWEERLPENVMVMDFKESLNTFEGQDQVLGFFGIPPEKRKHYPGLHLNKSDAFKGMLYKDIENVHGTIRVYEDPALTRQETLMQLRSQVGEIRNDLAEAVGGEYPVVFDRRAMGVVSISGSERHRLSEAVGYGADVSERASDDGDVVHGKSPRKAAGGQPG